MNGWEPIITGLILIPLAIFSKLWLLPRSRLHSERYGWGSEKTYRARYMGIYIGGLITGIAAIVYGVFTVIR